MMLEGPLGTPRSLTIEVLDRTAQIDQAEWDALCQAHPLCRYRWLRLAGAVLLDFNPRYVLLRRNGRLEAAAACTVRHQFMLSAYLPGRLLQAVAGRFLARYPSLSCEIPVSFASGLLMRPGCDPDDVVPPLLWTMQDLAAQERAAFVWLANLDAQKAAWLGQHQLPYHLVPMLPETCLTISWPTFEDYQASRSSKKRRELRRMCRRAQEAGISVKAHRLSPQTEPLLGQLVGNLLHRYGQENLYAPDLFSQAKAVFGDDMSLLVAQRAGAIVACVALLRSGDVLLPKWMGMDYRHTENTYTYHLLLAEAVAQAIEMGVRYFQAGPTTYEVKKLLGAVLEARYLALAARHRGLHRLLGWGLALAGKSVAPAAIDGPASRLT